MPIRHKVTLEAFRDENTGLLGLGIAGMPRDETTNAAHDGLTIAHDLLEHVNGPERIGTISDELEALGAIWYVRGQHGELRRDGAGSFFYSVEQNIARDVTRMFRDWFMAGCPSLDYCPITRAVTADDALEAILCAADESWRGEFNDGDVTPETRRMWQRFRDEALVRMRRGYSKARARWERHGRYAANSQFWAIAEAVEPYARRAEFEGQRFELTWGSGEAQCSEVYDYE
jgi:hypothetical protein